MKEELRRIYRKIKCILKSIPKNTSDLVNDGENGVDPFVTASTLPPSIPDTDFLTEGVANLYYTDTRVSNNTNVSANTAARHNAATIGTANGLTISGTQVISLDTASSTTIGALTNTDWNTFNNKVSTSRTISTASPLTGGGNLSANRTLSILQANGGTDGFLSSTDWTTFNNKLTSAIVSLGGLTGATQTFGQGSAGTSPNIASGGTTHVLNVPLAAASVTSGTVSNGTQTFYGAKTFDTNVHTNTYWDTVGEARATNGYKINNSWALRHETTNGNTFLSTNQSYSGLIGLGNFLWGRDTGAALTAGNYSILMGGTFAVNTATICSSTISLGSSNLRAATSIYSTVAIGTQAGERLIYSEGNNFIGTEAGKGAVGGTMSYSTGIGSNTFANAVNVSNSVAIGDSSGFRLENATNCVSIGNGIQGSVLTGASNLTSNTIIGSFAGSGYIGNYTTLIGGLAGGGVGDAGNYNIYIGFQAGFGNGNVSNKLSIKCHISNTLVTGDGATKIFAVDGRIRVADGTSTAAAGDIRYNSVTNKHQGYNGTIWNDMY